MRKTFNIVRRIKESVLKTSVVRNSDAIVSTVSMSLNSQSPKTGESGKYIQDKVTYYGTDHIIHPGSYFRRV